MFHTFSIFRFCDPIIILLFYLFHILSIYATDNIPVYYYFVSLYYLLGCSNNHTLYIDSYELYITGEGESSNLKAYAVKSNGIL